MRKFLEPLAVIAMIFVAIAFLAFADVAFNDMRETKCKESGGQYARSYESKRSLCVLPK